MNERLGCMQVITCGVVEAKPAKDDTGSAEPTCLEVGFGFPQFKSFPMSHYSVHTIATAPEGSRPSLEALQSAFGFIPNIAGTMATSPVLIDSLVGLFGKVHGGSFTEPQIQVLLLTNAVTNAAEWAVAFHTALALRQGLVPADVESIRSGGVPREPTLAALSKLARALIETRGKLDLSDLDAFLHAGFTPEHLLEAIAVSAASTITNYTANVTKPPLEAEFSDYVWPAL